MDRFDVQNAGEITLSMLMPFVLVHARGRASTFLHHAAGYPRCSLQVCFTTLLACLPTPCHDLSVAARAFVALDVRRLLPPALADRLKTFTQVSLHFGQDMTMVNVLSISPSWDLGPLRSTKQSHPHGGSPEDDCARDKSWSPPPSRSS